MTRILQGLVRIVESKVVILGHVGVIWLKMARILQGLVIIVENKVVICGKMGEILPDLVIIVESKVVIWLKMGGIFQGLVTIVESQVVIPERYCSNQIYVFGTFVKKIDHSELVISYTYFSYACIV